ncbi:branched chain amino acid aminotransferase [Staphylococcus massiliensis]|uniref:Branched-chain amino acid aminotransferase n=1 Tax=Staphylococcus massiliensis S46 TaxID=1229783 RepID=K9AZ38_9STAP|nr:branched-chain amino acid aminotransferase [Staphylococcus massiliensis S46]MCG3411659.1 branched-chain amino acid aminotransferase [Staphylococcus massiliensis]PNZ99225.1 branched-chain amino acid aminotransferase [Staphylococcus massiliensis CCUG 55927]
MENVIFIDEKFFTKEYAKISVYDHGLLYGYGVYEGNRCYSKNIFQLNEQIERLYKSAKIIDLIFVYTMAISTRSEQRLELYINTS